jgi:hypothetical protein
MSDNESINDQVKILHTLRTKLRIQIEQYHTLTPFAPAYLQMEIDRDQAQVKQIKKFLRENNIEVRDEPEDRTYPPTHPAAATSSETQSSTPLSMRETKKQTLNKRIANLIAEHEAVNNQIDRALNDGDRLRLGRQSADLERQIQQVEDELKALQ